MSEQGFTLSSPDFADGAPIPTAFTCEGNDKQPTLRWMHRPEGTKSFALIVDDPDAPDGVFTHWVKFNISSDVDQLDAGAAVGVDGKNDFQADGYGGPCPPPNHGPHRYYFRLYALDVPSLDVSRGAPRQAVEKAMDGHILGTAQLMGTFERSPG